MRLVPHKQWKVEVSRRFGQAESLSEQGSLFGDFAEKHRGSEGIHIHFKSGANRF
jgi:hypothetical protein